MRVGDGSRLHGPGTAGTPPPTVVPPAPAAFCGRRSDRGSAFAVAGDLSYMGHHGLALTRSLPRLPARRSVPDASIHRAFPFCQPPGSDDQAGRRTSIGEALVPTTAEDILRPTCPGRRCDRPASDGKTSMLPCKGRASRGTDVRKSVLATGIGRRAGRLPRNERGAEALRCRKRHRLSCSIGTGACRQWPRRSCRG